MRWEIFSLDVERLGDDESGGAMTVRPHGQMIVKVGDYFEY